MEENILVIKHGALGDFVLASGKMRLIREWHKSARITLITEGFLKQFAECMGLFDEIVVDSRGYNLAEWWRVVKKVMADRNWNVIYDLQSSNRTKCRYYPLALFATRHQMKWGVLEKGGMCFRESRRKLPFFPARWRDSHEKVTWWRPDLSMCHGKHEHFNELPAKYALLIPGCSAGNGHKRWPPEKYRALTEHFAAIGLKSVVIGTKAEANEINAICDGNENAVNFLGKNSIADIPDLANGAAVVVGNDTGPSHISYIAGGRVVMLFIDKYFIKSSPKWCDRVISLHAEQIGDISLDEVKDAVRKLVPSC